MTAKRWFQISLFFPVLIPVVLSALCYGYYFLAPNPGFSFDIGDQTHFTSDDFRETHASPTMLDKAIDLVMVPLEVYPSIVNILFGVPFLTAGFQYVIFVLAVLWWTRSMEVHSLRRLVWKLPIWFAPVYLAGVYLKTLIDMDASPSRDILLNIWSISCLFVVAYGYAYVAIIYVITPRKFLRSEGK